MSYLKYGVIRPDTSAPGLTEAREKLQYYSMSEAELRAYDEHLNAIVIHDDVINTAKREGRWEGRTEGLIEGQKEGLKEGAKNEKIEIAKRMKSKGLDIAMICQITELSEEEVRLI